MNKSKTKLLIGITGLVIGIMGTCMFPLKADALGGLGGKKTMLSDVAGYNGNIKRFNAYAPSEYRSWYGNNTIFKILYGDVQLYSPIAPPGYTNLTNIRSYGRNYENAHTSLTAFKTFAIPLNSGNNNKHIPAHCYNDTSPYKGQSGEWRYIGYSNFGDVISNPYFPNDSSTSTSLGNYPWDNPWSRSNRFIGEATKWDNSKEINYYPQKLEALRGLIAQEPTMRAKSSNVNYWTQRLSLRSDPIDVSAIFAGTRGNGTWYRTAVLKKPTKNLRIVELTVRDHNGTLMGTYTRTNDNSILGNGYVAKKLETGNSYTVSIKVKNTSDKDTVLNPAKLKYGYSIGEKAWSNVNDFSDSNEESILRSYPNIKAKETREFPIGYVTVPDDANGYFRVHGIIGKEHYPIGDNMNPYDDTASLIFQVGNTGYDLFAKKVTLIDKKGNVANRIIPGEDYKIRYTTRYNGERIWRYRSTGHNRGYWYQPKYNIPMYGTYSRKLPGGGNETKSVNHTWNSITVYPGQELTYDTPTYETLEAPAMSTNVRISPSTSRTINWDQTNDTWEKRWQDFYDISVSNVRVVPRTERPTQPGEMHYGVIYDADLTAPDYASNYEKDVAVAVTINGKTYEFVDHLKRGKNKNITKEFTVPIDPAKDRDVIATVYENYDKYVWEEDLATQKNNKGTGKAEIIVPSNPSSGACPLGLNTHNSWTQTYNIHRWTGYLKSYSANGRTYSFYQYSPVTTYDYPVNQDENYRINNVLFRSKLTEDLKLGSNRDGWVDIAKGEKGKIKAGYGYELKVEVEYNTNAFTTEPSPWINGGQGQWVRPQNVTPNLPNEIYIKTHDEKLLSVSGVHGTNPGLVVSRTGDKNKTIWTYSIKPKNTLGIKQTPKIYIDPETKDGIYNLQIFTPDINGIPTKPFEKTLCDNKNLKIEVLGSAMDDLNNHIVQ